MKNQTSTTSQPTTLIFKSLKVGIGTSYTAETLADLDQWTADLKALSPGERINRGDVIALITATLKAIGWKPGMKVILTVLPDGAGSPVTTPSPRANQPVAKSKRSSAKP